MAAAVLFATTNGLHWIQYECSHYAAAAVAATVSAAAADVTAEVSSLTRLTNDAFRLIQDTSFRLKCLRLRCHDFSALAD